MRQRHRAEAETGRLGEPTVDSVSFPPKKSEASRPAEKFAAARSLAFGFLLSRNCLGNYILFHDVFNRPAKLNICLGNKTQLPLLGSRFKAQIRLGLKVTLWKVTNYP